MGLADFELSRSWLTSSPDYRALAHRLRGIGWPRVILAMAMGIYAATFTMLLIKRHNYFGTFDFDQGIFDQGIWLVAHGHSFITIRGLDFWGHHANFGLLLFVPFYWLGAGPNFLNASMVIAATLGAIPVHRLALRHLTNEWHALIPPLAYLLHFSLQWTLNETIHPDIFAITPFMFAYLAATEKRWRAYAFWIILAMSFKEDIALAAFMLGFVLLIRGGKRPGIWTMVGAAAWFLFTTQVLIPAFTPEGAFYDTFFGPLGSGPAEIAGNAVAHPSLVYDQISANDGTGYVRDLNVPYGGLAFLSPLTLLIGLPNTLINLLNIHGLSANTEAHYIAMPFAATTLAMVEGLGRLKRLAWRRFALGLVAVCAVSSSVAWGIAPYSYKYDQGYWPLDPPDRLALLEAVRELPPDDAHVAGTYNFVPQLAHRQFIYTFPNPWRTSNWGIAGENPHDPATVDWLVIDRRLLGAESGTLLNEILATEDWVTVMDTADVFVAHRPEDGD